MMRTDRATAALEQYLAEVRHSLAGQRNVDVADVVAGVREHVEVELGAATSGDVTAEEMAAVLDRLGPPSAWAASWSDEATVDDRTDGAHRVATLWGIAGIVGWVVALGIVVVLLLGPAGLVWGQAQTGGVLEPRLMARIGASAGVRPRPAGYWWGMAAYAGVVSGVWWLLLGLVLRRYREPVRAALGPAGALIGRRAGSVLAWVGTALLLVSGLAIRW